MLRLPFKTFIETVKTVWNKSWTKLWGWILSLSGAFAASVSFVNSWVNDATIKSYLDTIDIPKSVSTMMAIIGLITYIAHGHEND